MDFCSSSCECMISSGKTIVLSLFTEVLMSKISYIGRINYERNEVCT